MVGLLGAVRDRLSALGREPGATLVRTSRRVVIRSYIYRWLTADPDPGTVVIDLRATVLGQFVALLDYLLARTAAAIDDSRTVRRAGRLAATVRAAPVRVVGVAVTVTCATGVLVATVAGGRSPSRVVALAVLAAVGLGMLRVTASWNELLQSDLGCRLASVVAPPRADEADDGSEGPAESRDR